MTSRADRAGQSEHFLEAAEWKEELRAMIGGKLPVLRLFTQDNATVRLRHDVGGYLLVVMVQKGDTNFGNTILIFLFSDNEQKNWHQS